MAQRKTHLKITLQSICNYYWRLIATGICFVIFGIGGLMIGYLIFPIVMWFKRHNQQRYLTAQYMIYLAFKTFKFFMQNFRLVCFHFQSIETLQNEKGCLFISNHPTLIDYVILISQLKHCNTVVKASLWHNIFVKKIIQSANYIPNIQAENMFSRIEKIKNKGENILIFPEGTRSKPTQSLSLQRGAANIAIRLNMPVRIIYIKTSESSLTKGSKWYKIPKQKIQYHICVGEKIYPGPFLKDGNNPSIAARKMTEYFTQKFEQGKIK